jgi:NAD(P)-dependent dehydrogenase (short-subunit alcohol dehydrogenase family)
MLRTVVNRPSGRPGLGAPIPEGDERSGMRLLKRKALVTGGSRSIGRAIAIALAKEGCDVVVNFKTHRAAADEVVKAIEGLGRRSRAVAGSTDARTDVERFVAEADQFLDGVDLLVNNAGILIRTPFLRISEEEWDRILDTNLKGYFLVGQAVARGMVDRRIEGAIVNVSSAGQLVAAPNLTHYCTAKAGIEMLTKQMALELAPHRIRVNAVAPGLIETDLNRGDIADPAFREKRLARIPLKEIGVPEDVTAAVVFLASNEEARLVTGASVFIDGGQTIWGA